MVDTSTLRKVIAKVYSLMLVVVPFVILANSADPSCELRMGNATAASVCTCTLVL